MASALGRHLLLGGSFLIALGFQLLCTLSSTTAYAEVSVGKPAPQFSLPGMDGASHSLAQYQGKYVVLEWLNPECPYVRKHYQIKNMQALQKRFTEKGVIWFSVNSSAPGKQGHLTAETAKQFVADRGASPTQVLFDPEGTVGKLFGATTTPHMFVINPAGVLIYAGAIDDNDSSNPDSVKGAKNYVALALEQAFSGLPVTVASTRAYGCSVKYAS